MKWSVLVADMREIVLSWVGTPFKHQGRIKGHGVDCVGVVMGVMRETQALPDDELEAMERKHRGYGRNPSHDRLRKGLEEHHFLVPYADRKAGDVLLMRFDQEPQHLAIYLDGDEIVHAYSAVGHCVHHGIDRTWAKRVVGVYRLKAKR